MQKITKTPMPKPLQIIITNEKNKTHTTFIGVLQNNTVRATGPARNPLLST